MGNEQAVTSVLELVCALSAQETRGYDTEFNIQPDRDVYDRFLVIQVKDSDPDSNLNGEWWFSSNGGGAAMQIP